MTEATPANEFVTDTIGLVLRIEGRKMEPTVQSIFEAVEAGSAVVYVPALVFAEILYLSEKRRIGITLQEVADYLKRFPNCKEYPMSLAVIQSAAQITDIPKLHDRCNRLEVGGQIAQLFWYLRAICELQTKISDFARKCKGFRKISHRLSNNHDRLIAGTARFLNLALITNDPAIQASAFVKAVW